MGGICVSTIIGLYTYPHYDLVMNGPVTQIEKLSQIINIFNNLGICIDEKILTVFWMIARAFRNIVFEVLYFFVDLIWFIAGIIIIGDMLLIF